MSFSQPTKFAILLTLIGFSIFSQVKCLDFDFPKFQNSDVMKLIMDNDNSAVAYNAIQVTPDANGANRTNQHGRVVFARPFKLWNSKGANGAFNTSFVLNIENQTNPTGGEGLAFILARYSKVPDDSHGQWLGIVNPQTNGSNQSSIVAIEFDTRKSFDEDIDDNHVGLNINSIYSTDQVSLTKFGVRLSNSPGIDTNVSVQYDGKLLNVFVGENMKYLVLSKPIDLSEYLPQEVYVGFSGSTSNYTQLNCVRSWQFNGLDMEDDDLFWVWIVVPLGVVFFIGIAAVFFWYRRYSGNQKVEDTYPSIEEAIQGSSTAPRKFKLKELSKATDKFNSKNKLGKGGFGTVYRGILENKEVAVKKVSKTSTQGKQEFIAEVTTIGNLNHRNLVKLIGWCYEKKEFLLVYEYMPNGSLEKFIHVDKRLGVQESTQTLDWITRLSIIIGVAQALDYLHNGSEKRVLHRDIKASNIMLDSDFNAKLGDFGLARTIKQSDLTHHSTKELAGTPGYMAPESMLTGRATVETDVYSFGLLIMEVACGKKPGSQNEENNYCTSIVNWLWELYGTGKILDAADSRLKGQFEKDDMRCVLILGLACCHPNPNKRPSMKIVLQVLKGEAPAPEVPAERPVFMWPPLPPSFKGLEISLAGGQLTPFTEICGR